MISRLDLSEVLSVSKARPRRGGVSPGGWRCPNQDTRDLKLEQ